MYVLACANEFLRLFLHMYICWQVHLLQRQLHDVQMDQVLGSQHLTSPRNPYHSLLLRWMSYVRRYWVDCSPQLKTCTCTCMYMYTHTGMYMCTSNWPIASPPVPLCKHATNGLWNTYTQCACTCTWHVLLLNVCQLWFLSQVCYATSGEKSSYIHVHVYTWYVICVHMVVVVFGCRVLVMGFLSCLTNYMYMYVHVHMHVHVYMYCYYFFPCIHVYSTLAKHIHVTVHQQLH